MKLYNLGHHPRWEWSQLIYHARPRLNMEGVIVGIPSRYKPINDVATAAGRASSR